MFYKLAHPTYFLKYANRIRPWFGFATLAFYMIGLWYALIDSPQDYQHKDAVRIMYVHVPASWLALAIYTSMGLSHAVGYIWKHPLAHIIAKSIAPIGLCLTLLSLITGAIWGKPMWGTWWVWDARLTAMFILMLLYAGYILLIHAYEDFEQGVKVAGVLNFLGLINIPIIKWSVNWWNTLHQPATLTKFSTPSIHPSLLKPLILMALAYSFMVIWIAFIRIEKEILTRKCQVLRFSAITNATTDIL